MAFKSKVIATVTGVNQEFVQQYNIDLSEKDRLLLSLLKFPFKTKTKVDKGRLLLLIQEFNNVCYWDSDFFIYETEFPELKY